MTASTPNGLGSIRKRMKTYGRAGRKRLPDHLVYKPFRGSGTNTASSVITPNGVSTVQEIGNGKGILSSHSQSTKADMFDVPSSEEEQAATTPLKKAKISHSDGFTSSSRNIKKAVVNRTGKQEEVTVQPTTSGQFIEAAIHKEHVGNIVAKHEYHHGTPDSQLPEHEQLERTFANTKSPRISTRHKKPKTEQPKAKTLLSTESVDQRTNFQIEGLVQTTTTDGDSMDSTKLNVSNILRAPTALPISKFSSSEERPSTPETDFLHHSMLSTPRAARASTPAILTPKGIKLWDGLLGEANDENTVAATSFTDTTTQIINPRHRIQKRQSSRRRLIDSLVEQPSGLPSRSRTTSVSNVEAFMVDHMDLGGTRSKLNAAIDEQTSTETLAAATRGQLEQSRGLSTANEGQTAQVMGSKITYSRQRSMLADQDLTGSIPFEIPVHDVLPVSKRRGSIPSQKTVQSFRGNDGTEDAQVGGTIRSIHELRQAGAQSRFVDEVEDLLDRIGGPEQYAATRRSGLAELFEKMTEKDFFTKFHTNGMEHRLFLHLGQEDDVVSGFLMISLLTYVLDSGITAVTIAQLRRHGITRLLIRLINIEQGIVAITRKRTTNMSRSAQNQVKKHHQILLQLRVWDELRPKAISPRTAALRCLELLVRQSRNGANMDDILSKELMGKLFGVLKVYLDRPSLEQVLLDCQLALSTLEVHSLDATMDLNEYLPAIKDILEAQLDLSSKVSEVSPLLRLILNVTNNSSRAADIFASPKFVELLCRAVDDKFVQLSKYADEDERLALVDHVILILVVMINIVEGSILVQGCMSLLPNTSLDNLVQTFLGNIARAFEADSVEDSQLSVAIGYLAVLLGHLSLSPELGKRISEKLETKTLQPLIACIDEFISHHKKVDELFIDDGEPNPQEGLTQRLELLVDRIKDRACT